MLKALQYSVLVRAKPNGVKSCGFIIPSRCFGDNTPRDVRVYEGSFGSKLKSIRRVSMLSSVVSTVGFPIAISIGASTVMPIAGQIAMASTIIITSLGSTLFLQLICHPYVTELIEVLGNDKSSTDRKFIAKRLSIFGRTVATEFKASEVIPIQQSIHPFASFKLGESIFYIDKSSIADQSLLKIFF